MEGDRRTAGPRVELPSLPQLVLHGDQLPGAFSDQLVLVFRRMAVITSETCRLTLNKVRDEPSS